MNTVKSDNIERDISEEKARKEESMCAAKLAKEYHSKAMALVEKYKIPSEFVYFMCPFEEWVTKNDINQSIHDCCIDYFEIDKDEYYNSCVTYYDLFSKAEIEYLTLVEEFVEKLEKLENE